MTPVTPVVFLDIDGVLNTPQTWGAWSSLGHPAALEPALVKRMAVFCAQMDARVVLSSTWRISSAGLMGTVAALEVQGWKDVRKYLRDCTPFMPGQKRSMEIRDWLTTHEIEAPFVVFDDDEDAGAGIAQRFVHVNFELGLTDLDVIFAEQILRRKLAPTRMDYLTSCN